jgi:hypothetical protein
MLTRPRRVAALAATVTGALALGVSSASAATTINVDPVIGKDTNSGSATAPLKTIGAALTKSHSGDTVKLAGGVYSAATNGEQVTDAAGNPKLVVPSGVAVAGQADQAKPATRLRGSAAQDGLRLAGTSKISDIQFEGLGDGVLAEAGSPSLKGLDFLESSLRVQGTAHATYTTSVANPIQRGGVFSSPGAAVEVIDSASLSMSGALFQGGAPNCNLSRRGVFVDSGATVTLADVHMFNIAGDALAAFDNAKATLSNSTVQSDYPAGCVPRPVVRELNKAQLTVTASTLTAGTRNFTTGLQVQGTGKVTVTNSTVKGWGSGIRLLSGAAGVTISGSKVNSNAIGINASAAPAAFVDVAATQVDDGFTGIDAGALRLRGSSVQFNLGTGIVLEGVLANLGQHGDPGNNTITGNGPTGVRFASSVPSGGILAVGNTWEPTQGADSQGHYPTETLNGFSTGAVGRNFTLPLDFKYSIEF